MELFQVYKLRQTVGKYFGRNIYVAHSFVSLIDGNSTIYYVMSYGDSAILVYNEYWEYQRLVNLTESPAFSAYSNNQIFITGDYGISIYDKYLNFKSKLNNLTYKFRGIYVNEKIYAAAPNLSQVLQFNQNLTSFPSYNLHKMPRCVTEHNYKLVISTFT